jgi:hypothetical protein
MSRGQKKKKKKKKKKKTCVQVILIRVAAPCSVAVGNQRFGGRAASIFRIEFRGRRDVSTALILEDGGSTASETLVSIHHATRRSNQQNNSFYWHRHDVTSRHVTHQEAFTLHDSHSRNLSILASHLSATEWGVFISISFLTQHCLLLLYGIP